MLPAYTAAYTRVCVCYLSETPRGKNRHASLSNSLLKNKLTEESPTYVTSGGVCPPREVETHVHSIMLIAFVGNKNRESMQLEIRGS